MQPKNIASILSIYNLPFFVFSPSILIISILYQLF